MFEVPIVGKKYILYRPNEIVKSRLDRFLVLDEKLHNWLGSEQYVQDKQAGVKPLFYIFKNVNDRSKLKPFQNINDAWYIVAGLSKSVIRDWDS